MNSHFFYPTASGSLGEARRLGFQETLVRRELENPSPNSSGQFEPGVESQPAMMAEDQEHGLHSDSSNVPTAR